MTMAMQSKRRKGQCLYIKKQELEERGNEKEEVKSSFDIWLKHQTNFGWKQKPHAN